MGGFGGGFVLVSACPHRTSQRTPSKVLDPSEVVFLDFWFDTSSVGSSLPSLQSRSLIYVF